MILINAIETRKVRIKPGVVGAGRKGLLLGGAYARQWWAVVLFEGDEDPTCFKAGCLEVKQGKKKWERLTFIFE